MQLRLVAGPLGDAATAAKLCAVMTENGRGCETAVYDGQRLSFKADDTPAAAPEAVKPAAPAPTTAPTTRRRSTQQKRASLEEPARTVQTAAAKPAQTASFRCCSMRSRRDRGLPFSEFSCNGGTLGGGGDGGTPRRFVKIHFPRSTGEVRFGYDVTVKMLACPSSPRRASFGTVTRRNWLP